MRDLMQAPTESLVLWFWYLQGTVAFLESGSFDKNSDCSYFLQSKQPLWAHAHAHLQMYAHVFLCLTWVWDHSEVQIPWSNALAVLVACVLLLAFTLPNKRSHPAELHRAHLQGRRKHILAFRLHTIPLSSPLPAPAPVTNDLRQAVNEKHKANTI